MTTAHTHDEGERWRVASTALLRDMMRRMRDARTDQAPEPRTMSDEDAHDLHPRGLHLLEWGSLGIRPGTAIVPLSPARYRVQATVVTRNGLQRTYALDVLASDWAELRTLRASLEAGLPPNTVRWTAGAAPGAEGSAHAPAAPAARLSRGLEEELLARVDEELAHATWALEAAREATGPEGAAGALRPGVAWPYAAGLLEGTVSRLTAFLMRAHDALAPAGEDAGGAGGGAAPGA